MKRMTFTAAATAMLMLAPTTAFANTEDIEDLTILATTDSHGTMADWDYFTHTPFSDTEDPEDIRGLSLLSHAIAEVRAEKGEDSVLLVDNGDANQGNPLASVYHANRDAGSVDPVASALNYLNYDAGTVGNHEFNYGLDDLMQYQENLDMDLLGANVKTVDGEDYLDPYTLVTKTTADNHEVTIGILGLVTPGVPTWDGPIVNGVLEFDNPVVTAQEYVPQMREAGADVVVVLAHTGLDAQGYTFDPNDRAHDVGTSLATQVSGIDVIIGGHSHSMNDVQQFFTNPDGETVLWSQPGYHARFLSNITLPLVLDNGEPVVQWPEDLENADPVAVAMPAADYVETGEDAGLLDAIEPWHSQTIDWVSEVVATATETMSGATSPWEDTAILDFVHRVQTDEVERGLAGTEYENLPVLSEASPFSRDAVFPEGDVTVANMAGLYTFDNTLLGVKLTGAQVKDYLEHSARYYVQQEEGAEITDWSEVTNAYIPEQDRNVPDYALDQLSGVNYHINISKPVGERIENLTYPDGTPVGDDDEFVLAINNYRQSGGQNYPHVAEAEIVYDETKAIRDLMIDWAIAMEVIDPADFFEANWTISTGAYVPPVEEEDPVDPVDPVEPGEPEDPADPAPTDPTDPPAEDKPAPDKGDDVAVKAPEHKGGDLAKTGASVVNLGAAAAILLALGVIFMVIRRRSMN